MKFEEIVFERHGAVAVLKFNRPEVRNCIGPRTHRELIAAFDVFHDDDALSVLVITGVGDKAFCSGADLKQVDALVPTEPAAIAAANRGESTGYLGPSRRVDIYKPIIAAINGVAYAGGLEWACLADMRIAEEHASFGVTCRRWNIGLADGGTVRLPRIIGTGRALDLIITGRVIDAREAERIGLVNEIVPKGASLARALELAQFIAALPQDAIRTDKESVLRGEGESMREALRIEAECFNRLIGSDDMRDGLRRFADRDHPDRQKVGAPLTPGLVRDP